MPDATCHCCDAMTDDPVSAGWTAYQKDWLCEDCASCSDEEHCIAGDCFNSFLDPDGNGPPDGEGWMQDANGDWWCSACWRARQPGG